MADQTPTPSTLDQQIKLFEENNYQQALQTVRQLTCHCVLFVSANKLNEEQKTYLHSKIMYLASLYQPKEGI